MAGKSGVFRAQVGGDRVTPLSLPDSVEGREVEAAGRDSAWVASGDRLLLYHDGTVHSPDAINARITGAVRALTTAPGGRLWVATESEVVSASGSEIKRYPGAGGEINTMHVAPSGALWLTIYRSGLLRITDGGVERVQMAGSPEKRLRGWPRD
jgi:ligand-binding sensor domain-containing protein